MQLTPRFCVLALLMTSVLAACSGTPKASSPSSANTEVAASTSDKKPFTIGYAGPAIIGSQADIQNSFMHAANDKGWNVLATTSNGDPQKQSAQIEHFIALHVNAIVAVPEDSKSICPAIEDARRAGILFYTIDRAPEGCKVNMSVLSDNFLAGRQVGEALVERLQEKFGTPKGKVLELTGNASQSIVQLRSEGFASVLRNYPEIQLITKSGDWDAVKAQEIVHDVLNANTDLDAIYMHSDTIYTEGTMAALRSAGRLTRRNEKGHVLLTGIDASPACVNAIKDGYADACSNQPLLDFSMIVNWIERELQGQAIAEGQVTQEGALWSPAAIKLNDIGPELLLPTTPVTARNVDDPGLWANQ